MIDEFGEIFFGFLMGKFKLVFLKGYIILRFELCVVVFVIELGEVVCDYLKIF